MPFKRYFSKDEGGINLPEKIELEWVKFEEVEKCSNCAKLTDKEIAEIKKENQIHSEVGDELLEREIKNHGWAK